MVKEDPNNKFGWYNLGVIAQYQHDANALWYLGLALRMPHTKAADREATHFLNAALKLNPALGRALNTPSGTGRSGGSAPG